MPNIPKTGNAQGMPLLALFLNAVFEIERAYHQQSINTTINLRFALRLRLLRVPD